MNTSRYREHCRKRFTRRERTMIEGLYHRIDKIYSVVVHSCRRGTTLGEATAVMVADEKRRGAHGGWWWWPGGGDGDILAGGQERASIERWPRTLRGHGTGENGARMDDELSCDIGGWPSSSPDADTLAWCGRYNEPRRRRTRRRPPRAHLSVRSLPLVANARPLARFLAAGRARPIPLKGPAVKTQEMKEGEGGRVVESRGGNGTGSRKRTRAGTTITIARTDGTSWWRLPAAVLDEWPWK